MTVTAQLSRGFERQIAGPFDHGMRMGTVDRVKASCMTGRAITANAEGLTDRAEDRVAIDIVTTETGIVDQLIASIG